MYVCVGVCVCVYVCVCVCIHAINLPSFAVCRIHMDCKHVVVAKDEAGYGADVVDEAGVAALVVAKEVSIEVRDAVAVDAAC